MVRQALFARCSSAGLRLLRHCTLAAIAMVAGLAALMSAMPVDFSALLDAAIVHDSESGCGWRRVQGRGWSVYEAGAAARLAADEQGAPVRVLGTTLPSAYEAIFPREQLRSAFERPLPHRVRTHVSDEVSRTTIVTLGDPVPLIAFIRQWNAPPVAANGDLSYVSLVREGELRVNGLLCLALTVTFGGAVTTLLQMASGMLRTLRRRNAQCTECGYSLQHLSGSRCPECGRQMAVRPRAGRHGMVSGERTDARSGR